MAQGRAGEPLFLALTVDVDPDANRPQPGQADAVSPGHPPGEAKFEGCVEGLYVLLRMLEEMSLPATLFWAGRVLEQVVMRDPDVTHRARHNPSLEHGCHGHLHEDFAGKVSGIPLGLDQTRAVLQRARKLFPPVFRSEPRGFRAPYCRLTPELIQALVQEGYAYDTSVTRRPSAEWRLRPYRLQGAPELWELALCQSKDRQGKPMSGYLWQLFEGNRHVDDYVHFISSLRTSYPGGLLQIALHPWHLVMSKDGRPFSAERAASAAAGLKQLLQEAAQMDGVTFTTAGAYLDRIRPLPD